MLHLAYFKFCSSTVPRIHKTFHLGQFRRHSNRLKTPTVFVKWSSLIATWVITYFWFENYIYETGTYELDFAVLHFAFCISWRGELTLDKYTQFGHIFRIHRCCLPEIRIIAINSLAFLCEHQLMFEVTICFVYWCLVDVSSKVLQASCRNLVMWSLQLALDWKAILQQQSF